MYQNSIKKADNMNIFPKVKITKKIENKTKLNGNFKFKSNNCAQLSN